MKKGEICGTCGTHGKMKFILGTRTNQGT